jgi:hypothetical protein
MATNNSGGFINNTKFLAILFTAVIGFAIYMLFAIGILDDAHNQPAQQYASCLVTGKSSKPPKSSDIIVESSCGKFSMNWRDSSSLQVQKTYNFTVKNDHWPSYQNIVKAVPTN